MKRWRLGLQDLARGAFRAPDGTRWDVEVRAPGASNAMVVFQHPDPLSRQDRYAWYVTDGPEARSVTARLSAEAVLRQLDERALARLFRKSMPVDSRVPRFEPG
ncbi:hypothetical protein [Roseisolibacter sp. H3M3-2]|uniref:hypothetical protein n=1 Tax=Roseisolibacter sp. H3M3-2 TaxID=3031323 RepID=UPI0023DC1E8B|nr:hypothetical protein [Roseisolibacter sp. H3M3-2]MDF1504162.1 hypothetical protein [Roseisolibacter sp. H3M3-2]